MFGCRPAPAFAALVIDRVEPGAPTADDEFIVVTNTGSDVQNISSWSVQVKNSGSTTTQKKNLIPGSLIAPGEEFIIAHKNGRFAPQAKMTYTSLNLSGNGGVIALISSPNYVTTFEDPTVVSSVYFSSASSTIEKTQSKSTTVPESKAVSAAQEFIGDIGRRAASWPILINELLPSPSMGDEYIEIMNTSADGVDVSGLWLRDASGAAYAFGSRRENTMLGAFETRAWRRSTTRIALNDTDGEAIFLTDQFGTVVDRAIYETDVARDTAFARFNNSWLWTQTITPSQPNELRMVQSPPIARAVMPPSTVNTHEQFKLSAEDSTDPNDEIKSYVWNFGDGNEFVGVTTTHQFAASGTFVIALTVTDTFGATSTVSKQIRVLNNTNATKIFASAIAVAASKPKRTASKKTVARNKQSSSIITIEPGILGRRKFVVNGRTVELTSDRTVIPRLTRGTVVNFTAKELFRSDRLLLQISAADQLVITALSTAPPFDSLTGEIIRTSKTGFDLATSSTDYVVLANGTRYADGRRVSTGDRVSIRGVRLHDDAEQLFFVVPSAQDISFLDRASKKSDEPQKNILLLAVSVFLLIGLQLFLSRFGEKILVTIKNLRKKKPHQKGEDFSGAGKEN